MYDARWRVLVAGFICYAFDAMDFMVLALSLPGISSEWHLSAGAAGLLGTASLLGVGLSSVLVGWFADNYGRRNALAICVALFALFTSAGAWAQDWTQLLTLRFLAGIGLGGTWGVVAAFVHEAWPARNRSRAIAWVLSSWPVGYIVVALIARTVLPEYGWRRLFLLGGGALIGALYVWLFVPESAEWLQQRAERGVSDSGPVSGSVSVRSRVSEIFARGYLRNTILGTLAASCALTGYWGANTWLPTYLQHERGLGAAQMAGYLVVLNVGMFAGYQVFGWIADQWGRRRSLLICFLGATLLWPIYVSVGSMSILYALGPVVGLFFAFTGAFGAYFPRLYPTRIRSLGAGFCFDMGRGISAFAPFAFGSLAAAIGLSASLVWSAAGFGLAFVVMLFMPDS
jgi:MFS family permease